MHLSDYDALLRRSLTASMLSSNSRLRSLAVGIFISGENGFQLFEHGKRSLCPSLDYDSYDSMDFTGTDNPDPPFDILMNLLNNDFESLVSRLWTAIFVDVLLATSYHTEGITLHIEASPEKFARKEWISAPITHRSNSTNQGLQDFLNDQYMTFRNILLREKSSCKTRHGCCISAVRLLLTFDTTTSQEYLEFLMCKYWELLSSDNERLELTHALEKLLSRSTYSQFVNITVQATSQSNYLSSKTRETNVIKCLLSVVAKLRPLPMLSLELLLSLAANYNCWHEVRSIFEMQYHALEKVTNEAVLSCKAMLLSAIRRCFMELGEKDIWTTMKAKMCVFPSSHRAVSLDLYGRIEDALDCYSKLVEDVDSRRDDFQAKSSSLPSELEASLWEDQWVTLHRELCQWSVLSDYAKETGSLRLLMECAWKNKEWENLRSILSYPSIISLLETGDFEVKMSEIFLSIADGKLNEVENLHAQTAQICLYKWRLLPTIFSGCNAHSKLLHNFHRLVDIKESGQIMMETR
jgi:transformation/transcription domain-associated protein